MKIDQKEFAPYFGVVVILWVIAIMLYFRMNVSIEFFIVLAIFVALIGLALSIKKNTGSGLVCFVCGDDYSSCVTEPVKGGEMTTYYCRKHRPEVRIE